MSPNCVRATLRFVVQLNDGDDRLAVDPTWKMMREYYNNLIDPQSAAYEVLNKNAAEYSGQFLLDEEVLAEAGIINLSKYAFVPGNTKFYPDLFL